MMFPPMITSKDMPKDKLPPLWEHQTTAIERARLTDCFALFFTMGCGKSRCLVEILQDKFLQHRRMLKTIVFTPPIVVRNFKDEFSKFSSVNKKDVIILTGSQVNRLKIFTENPGDKIFITNYEALIMKDLFEAFMQWEPEALVFDESHKLKSTTAKRSKQADILANPQVNSKKKKPFVYLMSGSPILNSPIDIFQQFKVMDGGESFGYNYWAFRAKYFTDRNAAIPRDRYFPNWEPKTFKKDGFDAISEIQKFINKKGMRVEKQDALDLPQELSVTIKVGMTATQAKAYNEMKNDFVAYISAEKTAVATLAITKALRLMQITAGFVGVQSEDAPAIAKFVASPKLEALRDLLEEITEQGHKVLVWAVWKDNYEDIKGVCDELSIKYVEVHGQVSEKEKAESLVRFQDDPEYKVFIGHPGSGGIGINLVSATYSIFYSRTFSLEQYLQARARNHRGGQTKKVTHYDLVCENTIDEMVVKALDNKQQISDSLLRQMAKDL